MSRENMVKPQGFLHALALYKRWNAQVAKALKGMDDITDWDRTEFPHLEEELGDNFPGLKAELEKIKKNGC